MEIFMYPETCLFLLPKAQFYQQNTCIKFQWTLPDWSLPGFINVKEQRVNLETILLSLKLKMFWLVSITKILHLIFDISGNLTKSSNCRDTPSLFHTKSKQKNRTCDINPSLWNMVANEEIIYIYIYYKNDDKTVYLVNLHMVAAWNFQARTRTRNSAGSTHRSLQNLSMPSSKMASSCSSL